MIAPATALVVASGVLTQGWHQEHKAFDYACRTGTAVYALVDGVTTTSRNVHLGNIVTLKGEKVTYRYAHLDTMVEPATVSKGDVIGTCGNTGNWSYGSHVHLEIETHN